MLPIDPLARFEQWYADAKAADPGFHNAMCLATVGSDGRPSARMVLLKALDDRGFTFFTNLGSRKARELRGQPFAALTFHWASLERQVRIEGRIESVTEAEADAYFATRPRGSQLGAWASDQSRPLDAREALVQRVAAFTAKFEGADVPRPPHWSGRRVLPDRIEFWQGRPDRLHDREQFVRDTPDGPWRQERLFP